MAETPAAPVAECDMVKEHTLMHKACQEALEGAADALLRSYAADGDMFLQETDLVFPPRRTFDEAQLIAELLFPRYFNCGALSLPANRAALVAKLSELGILIYNGIRPFEGKACEVCRKVGTVLSKFGEIREVIKQDVHAAFVGDPASTSCIEIIRCYPGVHAIMVQRVAHEVYLLGAKVYARELTELAHRHTGADLHPGATIGHSFFLDHSTGTVIGETAILGVWCRIYQSVTIGALHFQQDESGALKKGYKRHPTLGSHVVVGSGAKVLGNIEIGDNVAIGANCWVQENIPANAVVFIKEHPQQMCKPRKTAPIAAVLATTVDPASSGSGGCGCSGNGTHSPPSRSPFDERLLLSGIIPVSDSDIARSPPPPLLFKGEAGAK